jgi:transposase
MAELQPRLELLLETRLQQALAPALAGAAEAAIRETREQLAQLLPGLVHEAVAKEIEQRRGG